MSRKALIFVRLTVVFLFLCMGLLLAAAAINLKHHALHEEDDDSFRVVPTQLVNS